MFTPTPSTADVVADLSVGRRRWIDALLLGAGIWCLVAGWPAGGLPLLVLAVVMPTVHWTGRKQSGFRDIARLVPPELAESHRQVLEAASLPGVVDPGDVVDAANDALLEVAALLAGRPPRGAAQRRFVAGRLDAMIATALALHERHEAWRAARAEVAALSSIVLPDREEPDEGDRLAGVLAVTLFPFFLTWDVLRGTVHGVVGLVDGLALRLRTVGTLVMRAGRGGVALLCRAWDAWRRARDRFSIALADARLRVDATRLRIRLRLSRVRWRLRRLRTG